MRLSFLSTLALAAAPTLAASAPDRGDVPPRSVALAQLTIHERLIIRVPHVPRRPPAQRVTWEEKRGPRCVAATEITGAALGRAGEVDLILEGTRRVRAKLDDDCPALAFYSGFYVKPQIDGKLCAKRDAIRSRSGARCDIRHFRRLVPAKASRKP